jgi:hypothetical protein
VTGAFGRSRADLGDFQPPTLETLPDAVARNVAIARARTRARILAVGQGGRVRARACAVAQGAVAAGAGWLSTTDIAEAAHARESRRADPAPHNAGWTLSPRPSLLLVAFVRPWTKGRRRTTYPWDGPSDGRCNGR